MFSRRNEMATLGEWMIDHASGVLTWYVITLATLGILMLVQHPTKLLKSRFVKEFLDVACVYAGISVVLMVASIAAFVTAVDSHPRSFWDIVYSTMDS
jgi:hypothetical protein